MTALSPAAEQRIREIVREEILRREAMHGKPMTLAEDAAYRDAPKVSP